jgi:predicted GIY-YIG superfamily endonuclease
MNDSKSKKKFRWTDNSVRNVAKQYETRIDFKKGNPRAYGAARHRGKEFMKEITAHMHPQKKNWTEENLRIEAKKYQTKTDFLKYSNSAYQSANRKGNNFLDDITSHMKKLTWWDEEKLKIESLKYNTRKEFKEKAGGAYMAAINLGILDQVTSHMEILGNSHNRMIYSFEFPDKHVYVGLTFNPTKRVAEHKLSPKSAVNKHIETSGLKPNIKYLTGFIDKNDAIKKEAEFLQSYLDKGWKSLNRAKTGGLGGNYLKWTDEAIRLEASKYNKFSDFKRLNPSAYRAAIKMGEDFINQITSHMFIHPPHKYYTDEELSNIAKKYENLKDFINYDYSAYRASLKRGIYKDITEPIRKLMYEKLKKEAQKYSTTTDFRKSNFSDYQTACALKYLSDFFPH